MSIFDTPLGPIGAPTAVLDRAAFTRNLTALRDVVAPVPLRIATKSLRVRALIEEALRHDGVSGLLAYSVAEARWLVGHGLRDVLDLPVVGEEATAADASVLSGGLGERDFWTVDPVDGTANFAAGREQFAIMVGLVRDGVPRAGWILQPVDGALYRAESGGGAWCGPACPSRRRRRRSPPGRGR